METWKFQVVALLLLLGTVTAHFSASATSCLLLPSPTYAYSAFSYTQETSTRYATPVQAPLKCATSYGPAFREAAKLLPNNVTYTTYSLNRAATATHDPAPYGMSAYAALWATLSYSSDIPFTTTAAPTPVASSELVFPPQLYDIPSIAAESCRKFPSDFMWGVTGSAFQTEGGPFHEGRGPSVVDSIGALPNKAGANDSVTAVMHYYLYKQDIARLAAIGIPYYSFSISWPRIVPFGKANTPLNTQALDHYDDVINTCLEYGVTPIVTLIHFDNPVAVTYNNESFIEDFFYYAHIVMARYSDRVPVWVTYNEPNLALSSSTVYNANTNLLMAHAKVYRWYKETLGGTGKVTMKFANNLAIPLHGQQSQEDVQSALRYQDFILGILSNPLFLGQQYPTSVLNTPGVNLTALTQEQIEYINGTADIWAFDPYVAQFSSPPASGLQSCMSNSSDPDWPECVTLSNVQADGWSMGEGSNTYPYIAPQYVRQQLGYVWSTFRPSAILISEFGFNPFDDSKKTLEAQRYDLERTLYYEYFLTEMLKARYYDGVNVIGALAWTLMDSNAFGTYVNRWGMQTVNHTDGTFQRKYKRSMFDYVDFFHRHVEN